MLMETIFIFCCGSVPSSSSPALKTVLRKNYNYMYSPCQGRVRLPRQLSTPRPKITDARTPILLDPRIPPLRLRETRGIVRCGGTWQGRMARLVRHHRATATGRGRPASYTGRLYGSHSRIGQHSRVSLRRSQDLQQMSSLLGFLKTLTTTWNLPVRVLLLTALTNKIELVGFRRCK